MILLGNGRVGKRPNRKRMPGMNDRSGEVIRTKSYTMTFGKYKGYTVEWLLDFAPSYIIWLADNYIKKFSDEIYNEAMENDMREFDSGPAHNFSVYYDDEPF